MSIRVLQYISVFAFALAQRAAGVPQIKSVECKSPSGATCELNSALIVNLDDANYVKSNASKLVPYLDRRMIKRLYGTASSNPGELVFQLKRTAENKSDWDAILGSPDITGLHTVSFSIGLEDGKPVGESAVTLTVFHWERVWVWIGIAGLLLALGLATAKRTNLLRDPPPTAGGRGPWSLGRCQMAFWTAHIFLAWVLLYLVTGDYNLVTASVLGLMGISTATAVGAVAIDSSKKAALTDKISSLIQEQVQLAPLAPAVGAKPATALESAAQGKINANQNALTALVSPPVSNGPLTDVLGPDTRFHRVQIILWTLGFGCAFWIEVWRNVAMPEFSSTLLALMGISSAGYVGFKLQEPPKV
jgi:hypothetical protein